MKQLFSSFSAFYLTYAQVGLSAIFQSFSFSQRGKLLSGFWSFSRSHSRRHRKRKNNLFVVLSNLYMTIGKKYRKVFLFH